MWPSLGFFVIAPQRFYPGELGEHLRFSGKRLGSERKNMWGIPHKYDDYLHAKDDSLMVAVCNQHSPWFYHLCSQFKCVCRIVYAGSIRSEVLLDFTLRSLFLKKKHNIYQLSILNSLPIFCPYFHLFPTFFYCPHCSTFGWISDLRAFPARHVWWHRSVIHHSLSFGLDCWLCESKYVYIYILYIYIYIYQLIHIIYMVRWPSS